MPELLETYVETRRYIFPAQTNAMGTAHGGTLLKWMEQTGAMSGMRFAGRDVFTVGMDGVRFSQPIPEGSIALLDSYVYEAGTSSVQARVRVYDENRHTGDRELAAETQVVLVAVTDDGESVTVPDLTVESEKSERLRAEAREDG